MSEYGQNLSPLKHLESNSEYENNMLVQKIESAVVHQYRILILKLNYLLKNYSDVVWLLGDGRSGTTWVSNLINYDKKYRVMFEPFHPRVRNMDFSLLHQYIRPSAHNEDLKYAASNVLSGKFVNKRVDSENNTYFYNGILIKDIFANLLSYWAIQQFSNVKPILLVRHPFSVAFSKYKLKHWLWETEPLNLLNQTELYEDHIHSFESLIRDISSRKNYILNQILIWCIVNYVPLRQYSLGEIHVCFYEKIYTDPCNEVHKIFEFIKGASIEEPIVIPKEIASRPSRVANESENTVFGTSPTYAWKNEFTPDLIEDGLMILKQFGFDNLYDDHMIPNDKVIKDFLQNS